MSNYTYFSVNNKSELFNKLIPATNKYNYSIAYNLEY